LQNLPDQPRRAASHALRPPVSAIGPQSSASADGPVYLIRSDGIQQEGVSSKQIERMLGITYKRSPSLAI
jgi:hypothetical protein